MVLLWYVHDEGILFYAEGFQLPYQNWEIVEMLLKVQYKAFHHLK